ncbi:MAG: tetratricopeptide repeat protein [Desulfomonilaceae bacterium]
MSVTKFVKPFLFCSAICLLFILTTQPACSGLREDVDKVRQQRSKIYSQGFFQEGKSELERGSYMRAIRLLTDAIGKGAPTEAFKYRGQAYEAMGTLDKAIADYSSYLSQNREDYGVYIRRGDIYLTLMAYDSAFSDFSTSLELNPSSQDSLVGRAISLMGLQKYSFATRDLKEAVRINPNDVDAIMAMVIASMLDNNFQDAKTFVERAASLEQDPSRLSRIKTLSAQIDSKLLVGNSKEKVTQESSRPKELSVGPPEPYAIPSEPQFLTPERSEVSKRTVGSGTSVHMDNVTGKYETSYMGHSIITQINQTGKKISGTVKIRDPLNVERNYHFSGSVNNGEVNATYEDGNFKGRVDMSGLVGTLKTNDGVSIPITISPH